MAQTTKAEKKMMREKKSVLTDSQTWKESVHSAYGVLKYEVRKLKTQRNKAMKSKCFQSIPFQSFSDEIYERR